MKKLLFYIVLLFLLVQPAYSELYDCSEALKGVLKVDSIKETNARYLYIVEKDGKYGIYHDEKETYLKPEYDRVEPLPADEYTYIVEKDGNKSLYNSLTNTLSPYVNTIDTTTETISTSENNNAEDNLPQNDSPKYDKMYPISGSYFDDKAMVIIKDGYVYITDINNIETVYEKFEYPKDGEFEVDSYSDDLIRFKINGKYGCYDRKEKKIYNLKASSKPYKTTTKWFTPITVDTAIVYNKHGFNHSTIDKKLIPLRIVLLPIELPAAFVHDTGNVLSIVGTAGFILLYQSFISGEYFSWWLAREAE